MSAFQHLYWPSGDGLKLHARDYPGDPVRSPVVCLPGLTRNARDFDALAARLAGARRVLAVDLRGRGGSEAAKDATSYVLASYVDDVLALLAEQGIDRYVVIGTSLGGLVAMLLAARAAREEAPAIAAALLNDVGPEIEPAGLARVGSYVGKASSFPTWVHAARAVAEANGDVYPDWGLDDWLAMAKRLYRVTSAGRIVLDYDLRIAEPFRAPPAGDAEPDLWQALAALRSVPTLIVRGGRSDVLAAATAERMLTSLDAAELVTVPGVGHAPTLAEPMVATAIDRLLARAEE